MHPPLTIIDDTDSLIAIEWLRENGFNAYAEHMEASMCSMCFVFGNQAWIYSTSISACQSGSPGWGWSRSESQSLYRSRSRSATSFWNRSQSDSESRTLSRTDSKCSSRS